jgi:opacity protein-like surface antigen
MRNLALRMLPAAALIAAAGAAGAVAAATAGARAHTSRSMTVRDEAYLHFVGSSGSQVIDEGYAHGSIQGRARARFTYNGNPTISARFTIYGSGWSLNGQASGRLSNPNSTSPSFRGSLTLTGGSGRYAHARGSGELFGVFYRRSYGLTVQALGRLYY